jgi:acyl-CoA synthetase (AMP-forming)/AMP-acid ligase II
MTMSAAAPMTRELATAMCDRIKVPIKQAYGLTETSPGAIVQVSLVFDNMEAAPILTRFQRWKDWDKFIGSVGVLCPNVTAKIVDLDEREVAVGASGEIWLKGPNIFKGYLNNPAGTANTFSSDGYFKTGDVGHVDALGNFYITDRLKELIKYKGFQVAPAELEGLLVSHPKVNDVAVLGIYDAAQATEIPRAYIVPAQGVHRGKETEEEIVNWLAARVAGHKRLRAGVRFVDEIPKIASGKILRRVLKEKAKQEERVGGKAKL